jgi:hypothetical protein
MPLLEPYRQIWNSDNIVQSYPKVPRLITIENKNGDFPVAE